MPAPRGAQSTWSRGLGQGFKVLISPLEAWDGYLSTLQIYNIHVYIYIYILVEMYTHYIHMSYQSSLYVYNWNIYEYNQIRSNEPTKLVFAWCLPLAMTWGMGGYQQTRKIDHDSVALCSWDGCRMLSKLLSNISTRKNWDMR